MPKEWGDTLPNISKFERAVPESAQILLASLQSLAASWNHVNYCGVVKQHKGIFVDLPAAAALKGYRDFYNPLKPLEVDKADTLVKAIVAKVEAGKPIVQQDADALFATMETTS